MYCYGLLGRGAIITIREATKDPALRIRLIAIQGIGKFIRWVGSFNIVIESAND